MRPTRRRRKHRSAPDPLPGPGPAATGVEVQLEIERNNREAIIRGVLGAPSYFVGDENFYGQDRLDFVERALAAR